MAGEPRMFRAPFHNPIEIFPLRDDDAIDYEAAQEAVCQYLSASDMLLLVKRPPAARRLIVGVDCDDRVLFLTVEVGNCRVINDEVAQVVCRFQTLLNPEAPPPSLDPVLERARHAGDSLETLLEETDASKKPAHERRAHPRRPYSELVDVLGEAEARQAFARDLSEGGFALLTTFPLPVGEVLPFQLRQPNGEPLHIQARIVRCTPVAAGFYDVGGQIVR